MFILHLKLAVPIAIALPVVLLHTLKAGLENSVEHLKYE